MRYQTTVAFVVLVLASRAAAAGEASIRETTLEIPTYAVGPEDKNPPLWNAKVYPYSMQTDITRNKAPQSYRAVILENDYIRVIVLPDVGGRIYAAHDKTNNDFDFIYHNHVIKPGLVALRGAWLSGGIEWNFPTLGHTVNGFSPVQYKIIRGEDGSVTCVVGTIEWVRRMKWAVFITVYPDRSCFRSRILVFNRTLTHNNGYFWSNAAAHAWPDTRVTFPPADCTYLGRRRNPQPWPIYRGKDVSWYKNTPHAHDYFCGTPGDYQGAYNHERDCGSVNCTSRHEGLGKKFWTWGTAPSGTIWEDILTDSDGQYIEIQSGRLLTQGDTWIFEPHLQESWKEYWYPVKRMKGFVKANPQAAVNFRLDDQGLLLAVNTTRRFQDARLEVLADGKRIFQEKATFAPAGTWQKEIARPAEAKSWRFILRDSQGRQIIDYCPAKENVPPPELEPRLPADETASVEEIYLSGYYALKHWNRARAVELFQEALKKDPGFTPALRALAVVYYKIGRFEEAYRLSSKVLRRNEDDYTARYYRALSKIKLAVATRTEEDLDLIGRRAAYRHVAPYLLASLAIGKGDFQRAEEQLRRAIRRNPGDLKARTMLAAVLRHLQNQDEARRLVDGVLAEDPIGCLAAVEKALLGDEEQLAVLRDDPQYYLETACDYAEMNLFGDAAAALAICRQRKGAPEHPFVYFFLGYLADREQKRDLAERYYRQGVEIRPDYVFPFRSESLAVLQTGIGYMPKNWKLHYYLGTLLTSRLRWKEGLDHLLAAQEASPQYAVLYRNLGEVYWEKLQDHQKAQTAYERALACDPDEVAYYVALDRLYGILDRQEKREKLLAEAPAAVKKDPDFLLRQAVYHVEVGQTGQALEILRRHTFHPWEGWTAARKVYVRALHLEADKHMDQRRYEEAARDLRQAMEYPENLGTGKPHNPNYAREYYKLGLCYKALGKAKLAREHFRGAADSAPGAGKWRDRARDELEKPKAPEDGRQNNRE